MNSEYTFDIFLCVAILTERRDNILKTEGAVELIGYINRWGRVQEDSCMQRVQVCAYLLTYFEY